MIPTYFHVITSSNTTAGGYLNPNSIQAQIDVLNEAYTNSGTGLSFNLVNIDCEYRYLTPQGGGLQ